MASPKPKKVVLCFEDKFGEVPASPKPIILMAQENSVVANQNTKSDDVIGGDIDSGGELYNTNVEVSGGVKAPMYYEDMGAYLKVLLGECESVAGNGTGVGKNGVKTGYYKHTFLSKNCIPSLLLQDTLEASCNKDGSTKNIVKLFNGLKANTMAVNASPEGDYQVDLNLVGATAKDSLTSNIDELDETNAIKFPNRTRIKNDHVKLFIDDDSNFYKLAKEFSFNVDRGTSAEQVLSAGAIVEDSKFELKGSLSSVFDGEFYKKVKSNKEMKTRLVFESGENKLEFYMEQTSYAFKDEGRSYGNKYPLNCDFTAFKTTAEAKLKVTLINKVKEY